MHRLSIIKSLNSIIQTYSKQKCINLTISKCYVHNAALRLLTHASQFSITPKFKFSSQIPNLRNETEQEFLIRLKNDPDTFGEPAQKEISDEGDLQEEKYWEDQPVPEQKLSSKQYADIIKSFIRKRKIKEAIDVLHRMSKIDRVKPQNYHYNLVLGACGSVGYTKKAFSLYNDMKKRALLATGGTYTALFNACSNSPWPEDGLKRAKHLRDIMAEKMYEPNETNYHAMIKAFGRCGDLATACSLVDEMISKKIPVKDHTINFLLQGCIQDKDAGFRHALLVWRRLVNRKIKPTIYTYNLMVRCIRDCGIGTVEDMNDVLGKILSHDHKSLTPQNARLLDSGQEIDSDQTNENNLVETENNESSGEYIKPNLLAQIPHLGTIISISEIKNSADRLLLVGGVKGFLETMAEKECTPDMKTFTQLLDCIPGSLAAEQELLKAIKKLHVTPDIDFFNMLIKKRSMRFDYESAKAVLIDMQKLGYRPNLLTYGVLALGCKTKEEALELIEEMKENSYKLNTEILGAMVHQGCSRYNFPYVLEIMEICLREEIKPSKLFMEHLKTYHTKCKLISNDQSNPLSQSIGFQKGFRIFRMRYKTWLTEAQVDDTDEIHPWEQFRQSTETDVRHYKEKAVRFKPKVISRFKVKTTNVTNERKYK